MRYKCSRSCSLVRVVRDVVFRRSAEERCASCREGYFGGVFMEFLVRRSGSFALEELRISIWFVLLLLFVIEVIESMRGVAAWLT